jgi:hypothetical protein
LVPHVVPDPPARIRFRRTPSPRRRPIGNARCSGRSGSRQRARRAPAPRSVPAVAQRTAHLDLGPEQVPRASPFFKFRRAEKDVTNSFPGGASAKVSSIAFSFLVSPPRAGSLLRRTQAMNEPRLRSRSPHVMPIFTSGAWCEPNHCIVEIVILRHIAININPDHVGRQTLDHLVAAVLHIRHMTRRFPIMLGP